MPAILTARDISKEVDIEVPTLESLQAQGVLNGIRVYGDKFVYLKEHVVFIRTVKELLDNGMDIQTIQSNVENGVLNVEAAMEQHSQVRYEQLSYSELIEHAREERIVGFRRMNKEELIECLNHPERREEISELVRERNRQRQEEHSPEVPVQETEEQTVTSTTDEDFNSWSYKDLVERAREERIIGFRRMTKQELIACLSQPERREEIIEEVRNRTRQRYGSGSDNSSTQNAVVAQSNTVQDRIQQLISLAQEGDLSEELLRPMNAKQIALVARGLAIRYFRRMTKNELIVAILQPERREEMIERAGERYEMYK